MDAVSVVPSTMGAIDEGSIRYEAHFTPGGVGGVAAAGKATRADRDKRGTEPSLIRADKNTVVRASQGRNILNSTHALLLHGERASWLR